MLSDYYQHNGSLRSTKGDEITKREYLIKATMPRHLVEKSVGRKVSWSKSHLVEKPVGRTSCLQVSCSHPFAYLSSSSPRLTVTLLVLMSRSSDITPLCVS